ncbi:MAG: hypothetical protein KGJ07_00635 [Patescibacteria group bacterium]|nr:hypothetical protein [Patescibacteria group bacterium]
MQVFDVTAKPENQNDNKFTNVVIPTTTYKHPDWGAERPAVPLLQRHSLGVLVDEILSANELDQYTGILLIGKSGSGKSTLTGSLVHRLHQKFAYNVKWYKKKDIQNFVSIVKKLPKTPHIIVFQDASYALNGLSDIQIEEIAAQLTFIRHNTQSRIIVIIQIHYSKAIEKFFRDTDITICTSITDNERTNIKALFGEHNSFKVDKFIKQYHDQKFKKYFRVNTSTWKKSGYIYKTNDPFRIALVSSIGECHSLLYPKESCAQCSESTLKGQFPKMSAQEAVSFMIESAGGDLNNLQTTKSRAALAAIRSAARQYIFVNKGRKVLLSHVAAVWNTLAELDHNVNLDWDDFWQEILKTCVLPRKTGYRFHKKTMIQENLKNRLKDYPTVSPSEVLQQKEEPESLTEESEDLGNDELIEE